MKLLIAILLVMSGISVNLTAQTKRFPFKYPNGKDSTGKTIYKQGFTDDFGKLVVYPFYDWISWDEALNIALGTYTDKNKKQFYGYIDSAGGIVIPFKYESLSWFNNDKIARFYQLVAKQSEYGFGASLNSIPDKIYGFINMTGTEILNGMGEQPGDYMGPAFSDGLIPINKSIMNSFSAMLEKDEEKKKRYELVSSYGNTQYIYHDKYIKPVLTGINNSTADSLIFIRVKPFYKGLAAVRYPGANWKKDDLYKRKNDYCLINKSGKIIAPPKYNDIDYFFEGTPRVSVYDSISKNTFYGIIDSTGKEIVAPRYLNVINYYKDYASVAIEGDKATKKVLWGIVDKKTGKVVVPCKYESVDGVYEGMAAVMQAGRWGFVNLKGEMIIAPKYVKVGYRTLQFKEGLAVVTTDTGINKKYGAIDKTGKTVIPFIYDELGDFQEGLAPANKGKILKQGKYNWQQETVAAGKTGYINKTGKTVIPFEYDGGASFNKGLATVTKDSISFSIDINGKNTLAAAPRLLYAYNAGQVELNNKNYRAAIAYLNEASAGGYAEADYSLGLMYYVGTDFTKKNPAEVYKLWTKAAAQNSANAQFGLGLMHAKGEGIAANTAEALTWFTKAAALNHTEALCELGVLNETGQWGLPVNLVESIKHYTQAAKLGNPRGMYLMGLAYYNGKGITKNMQTCRTWWEKAAAKNYKLAQDALKQYGGILK